MMIAGASARNGRPVSAGSRGNCKKTLNKFRLLDFLAVGPPRTRTTWLHHILTGHVGLPRGKKETHFFSSRYSFGLEWYARHFERCLPELPVGEVCPSYFGREEARERIKLHLPDCR